MARTLRSKAARALLWYAADGKCQRCGAPLGDGWHADHIVPWVLTHETNVHDMQALCPNCNRKKGTAMLRAHQRELDARCQEILAGGRISRIFLGVTPGGGKSLVPVILAHRLIPRIADGICWVVPRRSLAVQGEADFTDKSRTIIPHTTIIRLNTNDVNPARGLQGYVTTYQALIEDAAHTNLQEFQRRRMILVLDEPHHMHEEGAFYKAVRPLVDRAALTVFMSGTWERGDGKRVAFAPYVQVPGGWELDIPRYNDVRGSDAFISYTRTEALRERAIKPLRLVNNDGQTVYIDRDGTERRIESLAESGDYAADAIFAALQTRYAQELLAKCARDWLNHRTQRPNSKLLVVAHSIAAAHLYLRQLRELGIERAAIATSDETQAALAHIERYKQRYNEPQVLDALVTVAMAYEGLDVPAITHIACLTHIRSRPWIEQMAARAARVDKDGGPYDEQFGYIYGPDDPLLHACFTAILEEQEPFVRERATQERLDGESDEPRERGEYTTIAPVSGALTRERVTDLASGDGITYHEAAVIREALTQHNLAGIVDPLLFKKLVGTYERLSTTMPETVPAPVAEVTPSVKERQLRKDIQTYVNRYEADRGWTHGTLNKLLYQRFLKPRDRMTIAELQQVWAWLQEHYRLSA